MVSFFKDRTNVCFFNWSGKTKFVRRNQAPFVNKEMRKAIYSRSRWGINFWKNQTLENERLYKNQRNKYVSCRKKCIKSCFKKVTNNVIATNKLFWKLINSFLTNKSCHEQNKIMLNEDDKIVSGGKSFTWNI